MKMLYGVCCTSCPCLHDMAGYTAVKREGRDPGRSTDCGKSTPQYCSTREPASVVEATTRLCSPSEMATHTQCGRTKPHPEGMDQPKLSHTDKAKAKPLPQEE
eukprot:TRINITY_DN35799_c0_g1_i1.p3 TRINITY_DN35799_c0_g1~~TRINITY_DN35799_c0_g1_i1.p3  ORF type:complete len:103 (+),score=8.93 TRINITY_DN35799_c0_g1_i1:95-403(+)